VAVSIVGIGEANQAEPSKEGFEIRDVGVVGLVGTDPLPGILVDLSDAGLCVELINVPEIKRDRHKRVEQSTVVNVLISPGSQLLIRTDLCVGLSLFSSTTSSTFQHGIGSVVVGPTSDKGSSLLIDVSDNEEPSLSLHVVEAAIELASGVDVLQLLGACRVHMTTANRSVIKGSVTAGQSSLGVVTGTNMADLTVSDSTVKGSGFCGLSTVTISEDSRLTLDGFGVESDPGGSARLIGAGTVSFASGATGFVGDLDLGRLEIGVGCRVVGARGAVRYLACAEGGFLRADLRYGLTVGRLVPSLAAVESAWYEEQSRLNDSTYLTPDDKARFVAALGRPPASRDAELEGLAAYGFDLFVAPEQLAHVRRFEPWFAPPGSAALLRENAVARTWEDRIDASRTTRLRAASKIFRRTNGVSRDTRSYQHEYWQQMLHVLEARPSKGIALAQAREAEKRSRRLACRFGRERWLLSLFALYGYGERILRPLAIHAVVVATSVIGLLNTTDRPAKELCECSSAWGLPAKLAIPAISSLGLESFSLANVQGTMWDSFWSTLSHVSGTVSIVMALLAARKIARADVR
jgi:hypothetical protein